MKAKSLTRSDTGIMHCEKSTSDRGDFLIRRDFGDRNTDCIMDVRICDVNQASYLSRKPTTRIVKYAENETKKKYLEPCLEQRRHFTTFCRLL